LLANILFLIASYLAACAATIAGFGSSALLIPVAFFFMEIKTAIFIVAVFHLFNNLFKIRLFWSRIDFRTFFLFGVPSILLAFLGAVLVSVLPIHVVRVALGTFLIIYSVYAFLKPEFSVRKSERNAILGGSLSGFLAGLIGLGGAMRSAFLIGFNLPKEVYVGTSAMIAVVIDITRIPTYLATRSVDYSPHLYLIPFLIVSAYLGVRTGKSLLNRINQKTFRRFVLIALLLIGLRILF
jgi:uncharacterized membrane protein YfcA